MAKKLLLLLVLVSLGCKSNEVKKEPSPARPAKKKTESTRPKSPKTPQDGASRKEESSEDELDWSRITYTLAEDPKADAETQKKYQAIDEALGEAIELYLRHTNLTVELEVSYNVDVPTADAKPSDDTPGVGIIRFGGSISKRVAMHELGHVFGAGFWGDLSHDGEFHGPIAKKKLAEIDGNGAKINTDSQHFWPYGLNLDSDVKSDQDFINHCLMVEAIHQDIENARKRGSNLGLTSISPRKPIP